MSKPLVGLCYIIKCPKCSFYKAITTMYNNKIKYKCAKCNYIWEVFK